MITTRGQAVYIGASAATTAFVPSSLSMREADEAVEVGGISFEPWGDDNDTPQKIMSYVEESEVLEQNLIFNATVLYGRGVKAMKRVDGQLVPSDDTNVKEFWKNNDIPAFMMEQCTDVAWFNMSYPEFILNDQGKIVNLYSKEATYSRLTRMKNGVIEWHGYCSRWGTDDEVTTETTDMSPVLDYRKPLMHLRDKVDDKNTLRYILPVRMPTPGLKYYPRIPWTAVFRSGWYDLSRLIPQYKKALIENQLGARYIIYLSEDYFEKIFSNEAINMDDAEAKEARISQEYDDIENFLTGVENAGKGLFAGKKSFGKDEHRSIEVVPLQMNIKGGEYLEDIGEVHNIMCYGMGVEGSLVGSVPGKGSSLSGTEKRELFQIKQTLCKPLRDRLLKPFEIIRDFNGWDENIEFVIEDVIFTTLDENKSGQETAVND